MATGDINPFESSAASKTVGAIKYAVASGTTASIKAGEPVQKLAGAAYATAASNNMPTATLRIVGVAASNSNETASVDGTVDVFPSTNGQLWMIKPKVAATWNTQAKYNALIGSRVLIDLTTSTYTLLAADGAGNGCIVEYVDISRYPGFVVFSFSPLCDYRNV
jgi:hypothetical protein